jgi:hypothetical protein
VQKKLFSKEKAWQAAALGFGLAALILAGLYVALGQGPKAQTETGTASSFPATPLPTPTDAERKQVRVMYFHQAKLCAVCGTQLKYAEEAVNTGFKPELARGTVKWETVDISDFENDHFVRAFHLTREALVLVRLENGTVEAWKNLEQIWDLAGDKQKYIEYVDTEIRGILNE